MPSARSRKTPANQLRIIGGRWRSREIHFPDADALRPTPDRVRETLFNWLGQSLDGLSVLDLFAGSGALAFEALSRGAAWAVAVDSDAAAVASLRENAARLGATDLETHRSDAVAYLAHETRQFDVVFADPPFREPWLARLWSLLPARIAIGGWLYLEQGAVIDVPDGWELYRHRKAGQVHYHLLRRAATATDANDGAGIDTTRQG